MLILEIEIVSKNEKYIVFFSRDYLATFGSIRAGTQVGALQINRHDHSKSRDLFSE